MCGIIGIVQKGKILKKKLGTVLRGCLKNLEYRGYDSVGFAIITWNGELVVRKSKGKIDDVSRKLGFDDYDGVLGIAHTRWATHGKPSDINAHPHVDCKNTIAVVHNGIIENYQELKEKLKERGHFFISETDTEIIAHLIEDYKSRGYDTFTAFKKAIKELKGAYALAFIDKEVPDRIYFARNTSPLVIGLGKNIMFVSSDIPAFLEYTNRVIVLQDGEIGYITGDTVHIERIDGTIVDTSKRIRIVDWTPEMAKKAGYPHFMLKEIHEQPLALSSTLAGIGVEVEKLAEVLASAQRVFLTGAGTSYHATLIAEYLLNNLAEIPAFSFISSEYNRYGKILTKNDVLIAVSQSGETIDTLMAVRRAKKKNVFIAAISNVIDSAIPRESNIAVYTRAGPEIGVAATKTFTTQVFLLSWIIIKSAQIKGSITEEEAKTLYSSLRRLPEYARNVISVNEFLAKKIARDMAGKQSAYYLGRGLAVPVSMEGALKLKEIAYIHAEAYPAGESKHGPIALVEPGFPVLFTIFDDEYRDLILANIEEMKARGAWIIVNTFEENEKAVKLSNNVFKTPRVPHWVAPILHIIPYQLLAYYTSIVKGYDPDKPRNLAKTVTVE